MVEEHNSRVDQDPIEAWSNEDWSWLADMPIDGSWSPNQKDLRVIMRGFSRTQLGRPGAPDAEFLTTLSSRPNVLRELILPTMREALESLREGLSSRRELEPTPLEASRCAKIVKRLDVGRAWNANTVNTVAFRHHAILSRDGYQYTAYYADANKIVVIQRNLVSDNVVSSEIKGNFNVHDSHNVISLGIDRLGRLHMCYDHHSSLLKYRRTLEPHDIGSWSEEGGLNGRRENQATYPSFILPYGDGPLMLLYRDGGWRKGDAHIKTFREDTQSWTDNFSPILSGANQSPWTSNAYWNSPASSPGDVLHLSFTWRTDYIPGSKELNNINVGYAKSYDFGTTWYTSNNKPYRLPITQVNSETVHPVPPGSNLMNQCAMDIDSKGLPHIAFYANDHRGIPQYQHLWFDGSKWCISLAQDQPLSFSLDGGGTLRVPIGRPQVIVGDDDAVYVLFRGDHTRGRLVAYTLRPPDYSFGDQVLTLIDKDLGFYEPLVDLGRWKNERVLSLLVISSEQTEGDVPVDAEPSQASIYDIKMPN